MTTATLAAEAAGFFETAERPDNGGSFTRCKDGTPDWVKSLVRAGHADDDGDTMLPDDWRYSCIAAALEAIAEADDPDDAAHEFADGYADVYNSALTDWLGSHSYRASYCDAAVEEFDAARDTMHRIQMGQFYEAEMVYRLVLAALGEREEDAG